MERKLLLLVLFLGTSYFAKSQVIDVIGKGIFGMPSASLSFTDLNNIDSVRVNAIYSWDRNAQDNGVVFKDFNGTTIPTILRSNIIHKGITSLFPPGAYYTAVTNNLVGDEIFLDIMEDHKDHMQSSYAYIYRNIPSSAFKSFASLETVYFWQNSSMTVDNDARYGPYVYEIPINKASASRNIKVKIPISELEDDNRVAIIDIIAGDKNHHAEITTYNNSPQSNLGNSFFLGEYVIEDVSGDVDKILVSIYSPSIENARTLDYSNPDSFYVNGIIVDVDKVYEGCTLTQGYWKTHSDCKTNGNGPERDETWDDIPGGEAEETIFFESEQDYCEVFDTNSGKGGKYYILAHQYIAAELNILAGANPTEVQAAYDEATAFLKTNTPGKVKGNDELESKCVELGGILDDYNNGRIGPGHCDENSTSSKILNLDEIDSFENNVKIYPNPVASVGKINFIPKRNAETSIEVYNILGQKVSVLYNEYTMGGIPVSVDYDAQRFKKGIHFVHIKNGSSTVTKKLSISK